MNDLRSDRPHVLVVDDEPSVLEEVANALEPAELECQCCTTPEAAIAAAELDPPDLIISDINLGGHSGLAMCEQIKRTPALGGVPVMFLSAAQAPDIVRRVHAAGGAYYLRKPFDPEVLRELVDKALWLPHVANRRQQPVATKA
jgi:CheY-like chemotaxis protein